MPDNTEFFKLIKELSYPKCHNKMGKNDIKIVRNENDGMTIIHIKCNTCSKAFTIGLFGLDKEEVNGMLEDKNKQNPISYDEILDFHNSMPAFEKNFYRYLKNHELK